MTRQARIALFALVTVILLLAGSVILNAQNNFSYLIAPEPRLDASLNDGHRVVKVLAMAGFGHPRLYANTIPNGSIGAVMIPELKQSSDSAQWVDVSRDLASLGVPAGLPIYLQFRVDEIDDYYNVAGTVAMLNSPDPIYGLQRLMNSLSIGAQSNQRVLQIIANLPGVRTAVSNALQPVSLTAVTQIPAPLSPSIKPVVGACSGSICGVTANTPISLVDGQAVNDGGVNYVFHSAATPFGTSRWFVVAQ